VSRVTSNIRQTYQAKASHLERRVVEENCSSTILCYGHGSSACFKCTKPFLVSTGPQIDSGLRAVSDAVVEVAADAKKTPRKRRKEKTQSENSLHSNFVEESLGADESERAIISASEVTSEVPNACGVGTSFDSSSAQSSVMVCLAKDPVSSGQISVYLLPHVCSHLTNGTFHRSSRT
jgi:hypothetical protein